MSSLLHRVGRWCADHAGRVLAAWAAVIALLAVSVSFLGMNLSGSFTIAEAESMTGLEILGERLPQAAGTSEQVLFTASDGDIAAHKTAVEDFVEKSGKIDGIAMVSDPFAETTNTVSKDGAHVLVQVQGDTSVGSMASGETSAAKSVATHIDELRDQAEAADPALTVQVGGNIGKSVNIGLSATELIGVLIAVIVLFATFGSLVTAGAPILSAFIGVGTGMLALLVAASAVQINSVTPVLAVMIGLAVGIDYALFIISRAREYLATGIEPKEAAARANATAGSAVVFAGGTVIVALCGLGVAGIPFLTVMGVSSAAVVGIAVLVALTAVPALLGLIGAKATPKRRARASAAAAAALASSTSPKAPTPAPKRRSFAARWIDLITRIPALTVLVVIAILGLATLPATSMRLGLTDNGYEATSTEMRQTYDAIEKAYGPGYNSPIIVIADISQSNDPVGVVDKLSDDLAKLDGIEKVALATPNQDATIAFVEIIPSAGQTDPATTALVKEIRADAPTLEKDLGIRDVMVTGQTAVAIDIASQLDAALVPFGVVVVGLSILLLMIVFRSIAVPLTATIGYLLSLGAGFGAVGLVFGQGVFADALNVTKVGVVISFLPVIVMGVLFGLAMDYEVFLVSRMREEWIHSHDAKRAVRRGFIGSSTVVTAAAIIMTGVFAAFIPHGNVYIKPIATALTVGIAADAFLVRMTLIPALMALLGKSAWWIPGWLDRLLPVVDVEGEGLARSLEHQDWVAANGESAVRLEGVRVREGKDVAFTGLDLVLRAGEIGVVRSDDPVARAALAAVIGARLRPTRGRVVIGDRVLPDGTSFVQRQTLRLHEYSDPVPAHTRVVVIDDPGARRWKRVRELAASGVAAVVTGPTTLQVPADLEVAATALLSPEDVSSSATPAPQNPAAPAASVISEGGPALVAPSKETDR